MTITFSDHHLPVLLAALEAYERFRINQPQTALELIFPKECLDIGWGKVAEICEPFQRAFFPDHPTSGGPGICSERADNARIAYEIQKVVEQYLALKKSDGWFGSTRDFDGPLLNPSGLPFPKVKGLDEMQYKDFWIDMDEIEELYDNGEFEKIWDYAKSSMNLPNGEKMQIFEKDGGFSGYRGFYIRVHKPRKPLDGSTF